MKSSVPNFEHALAAVVAFRSLVATSRPYIGSTLAAKGVSGLDVRHSVTAVGRPDHRRQGLQWARAACREGSLARSVPGERGQRPSRAIARPR
jgi:hypothetical protein